MFAELVKLKKPEGMNRDDAAKDTWNAVPRWKANPDLIRKHFLYGEDGCLYGFYLWKSKEAALEGHNKEWQEMTKERTGAMPEFSYFDVMMILDNEADAIDEYEPAA